MKALRNQRRSGARWGMTVLLGCALSATAAAEPFAQPTQAESHTLAWKDGPTPLELGHGVKLDLPDGYRFLGMPDADIVMKKMGNLHNEDLLGLVISRSEGSDYFVVLRFNDKGFIKDDEELDGDKILDAILDGEEDYNAERKKLGFAPVHFEGWQEAPHYDKVGHRMVWGLIARDSKGRSVNYNTRVLGRKGYVSVNLVTTFEHLLRDKPAARSILAATTFNAGSRYEDFDASSDKLAGYGLTGLVLGAAGLAAAKLVKVGLLAKFGKLLLAALIAGKKAAIALLVAGGVAIKRLLGRSRSRS